MPEVWVVGVDGDGTERVRERLGHGADPARLLRAAGFEGRPKAVAGQVDPHVLEVVYDVRPAGSTAIDDACPPPEDPGLVLAPGETPEAYQRVAVYAVVRSERGILMAQNSELTNSPGTWVLPGGGIDPGELPQDAAHREVWEETGQRVELGGLALVSSRHWVGRAPSGRLEDFHAVRLVYAATCAAPTDPVVHDVGGTTSRAGWFSTSQVAALTVTPTWRDAILGLVHEAS